MAGVRCGQVLGGLGCLLLCSSAISLHGDHAPGLWPVLSLEKKGRVHLVGWQTLGIIAIMDGVECIHTFGAGESRVLKCS